MSPLYGWDLTRFDLERLKAIFTSGDLLPSRKLLGEAVEERFAVLEQMGLRSVQDVVNALSTPKKLKAFSQASGLPEDYLTLLRRQANSYIPNPISLKDLPGTDPRHVQALADLGVRDTRQLFERAYTRAGRDTLKTESGIPAEDLLNLTRLADVSRAGWVGPVFARLLVEAGADSIEALVKYQADSLYERLIAVNHQLQLTKAAFTRKDVAACIEYAGELSDWVEY